METKSGVTAFKTVGGSQPSPMQWKDVKSKPTYMRWCYKVRIWTYFPGITYSKILLKWGSFWKFILNYHLTIAKIMTIPLEKVSCKKHGNPSFFVLCTIFYLIFVKVCVYSLIIKPSLKSQWTPPAISPYFSHQ